MWMPVTRLSKLDRTKGAVSKAVAGPRYNWTLFLIRWRCNAQDHMGMDTSLVHVMFPVPVNMQLGFDPGVFVPFDLAALVQPHFFFAWHAL